MKSFRFAWRSLWRDLKSGELLILAAALLIAVTAISAVGFFTDRVAQGMERQAGDILAADLVIHSRNAFDGAYLEEAEVRGLRTSQRWSFASVIASDSEQALANAKAVAAGYPLRGTVHITDTPYGEQIAADGIPPRGTAWLDARLFAQLGIAPGDSVRIGESSFTATRVLERVPDEGFGFTSMAPSLLMNLDDIPDTNLIQPGSRVQYRLLFADEPAAIAAFRADMTPRLERGQEIQDVRDERPEVGNALDRASRFLALAAIVSVLLAAVAVAMAARRYASRHLDAIAIIKCVGGTQGFVLRVYLLQVLIIGLVGSLIGTAIGWSAQAALVELAAGIMPLAELPAARLTAVWTGIGTGLVVLAGFALPPLLPLRKVPPLRVLRRDLDPPEPASWALYGMAVAAVAGLLLMHTRDLELTGWFLAGASVTTGLLVLAAWGMLQVLNRFRGPVGVAWRYGIANIARRRRESIAQMVAFGLGIMVLLLLALVRTDLMEGWRASLTDDAPNHFLINIQTDERDTLVDVFTGAGLAPPQLHAMVRGRMTHLRGMPVEALDLDRPGARWFVEREANISWAAEPQVDNRIVSGAWWTANQHGQPLMSIEADRAARLDIVPGDTVTYDIAGEEVEFTVTSLRTVDWNSFNPNFFLVVAPGVLDDLPATWVGAVHVPRDRRGVMMDLLRALPTVTVIDIEAIIDQVRSVVDQATRAVEFVFLFTLLAGLIVMMAAINASRDERLRESAMLRTFGARRGTVLQGLASEFIVLGALSGLLAAAGAGVTGWLLATQVFEFDYSGGGWIWIAGVLGGGVGIGFAGLMATRGVLNQPPITVLREA